MKIEVNQPETKSQNVQCVFLDAFELGRKAALSAWEVR